MNNDKIKRLRYSKGQLLTVEDFEDQQEYHRRKLREFQKRFPIGIVEGLEVVCDQNRSGLVIQKGLAIDQNRNEIIVPETVAVPALPADTRLRYLSLKVKEKVNSNRIEETFEITWDDRPNRQEENDARITVARILNDDESLPLDKILECGDIRVDLRERDHFGRFIRLDAGIIDETKVNFDARAGHDHAARGKKIPAGGLDAGAVSEENIKDGAVTDAKLSISAITEDKLADNAVSERKIQDGAVTESKIRDNAVSEGKIQNNSISGIKIQNNAITAVNIRDNTLTGEKLLDNSISGAKLSADAVSENKIQDGAISENKIRDGAVSRDKVRNNSITADKISDNAVSENKIQNDAIVESKIKDGAIAEDKIRNGGVTEDKIRADAVTAGKIQDNAVTTNKIQNNAVTDDKILKDAIRTEKIQKNAVTTEKINDAAVTSSKLSIVTEEMTATIREADPLTGVTTELIKFSGAFVDDDFLRPIIGYVIPSVSDTFLTWRMGISRNADNNPGILFEITNHSPVVVHCTIRLLRFN